MASPNACGPISRPTSSMDSKEKEAAVAVSAKTQPGERPCGNLSGNAPAPVLAAGRTGAVVSMLRCNLVRAARFRFAHARYGAARASKSRIPATPGVAQVRRSKRGPVL